MLINLLARIWVLKEYFHGFFKNGWNEILRSYRGATYYGLLIISLVLIGLGTYTFYSWSQSSGQLAGGTELLWFLTNSKTFGFDPLALGFVFLTVTVIPFCLLYVHARPDRHVWACYITATEILIIAAFLSLDLLVFFIIFELLIFPIYKLILSWGSPGDLRLTASRSFVMYTVLGSLLLLFVIVALAAIFQTTNVVELLPYRSKIPPYLLITIFVSFATKIPTFPFYHWLTLAHVEASTVGSVILAALILKLGSYGFLRFLIPLFQGNSAYYRWYPAALTLFIVSMLFAAFSALVQTDLKRIIAYSSIEHINLSLIGLLTGTAVSAGGAYILILAHGWVSAGLFFAVGYLYDTKHQRDLLYYRGYATINAVWSVLFGLLLLANVGFPLTLNFFGEFQVLIELLGQYPLLLIVVFPIIIANIGYTVKLGTLMWGTPHAYLWAERDSSDGVFLTRSKVVLLLGFPLLIVVVLADVYYLEIVEFASISLDAWGLQSRV